MNLRFTPGGELRLAAYTAAGLKMNSLIGYEVSEDEISCAASALGQPMIFAGGEHEALNFSENINLVDGQVELQFLLGDSNVPSKLKFSKVALRDPINFGLMANNDGGTLFEKDAAGFDTFMDEYVSNLKDSGIDSLQLNVITGVTYYPTQVGSTFGWNASEVKATLDPALTVTMDNALSLFSEGIDPIRYLGEKFRTGGRTFVPSFRISDDHYAFHPKGYPLTTALIEESLSRPGWTLGEGNSPNATFFPYLSNMLNFGQKEIREYHMALMKEVILRYSDILDGFEIDFVHTPYLFPAGTGPKQAHHITAMVSEIRQLMDSLEAQLGRKLALIVRVPPSLSNSRWAGLNVDEWMSLGLVDVVIPSQIMTTPMSLPIAHFKAIGQTTGVKVYGALVGRKNWGWRPAFEKDIATYYQNPNVRYADPFPEYFFGAARTYLDAGADGLQLYNYIPSTYVGNKSAFKNLVLGLKDPTAILSETHVYTADTANGHDIEGRYEYRKFLPHGFSRSVAERFRIPIHTDPNTQSNTPILRVGLLDHDPETEPLITVKINGQAVVSNALMRSHWFPTATLNTISTEAEARSSPDVISPEGYLHFAIPKDTLSPGTNEIELTMSEDRVVLEAQVVFINKPLIFH